MTDATPLTPIPRIPAALLTRRTGQTIVCGWRDPALQRISDALRVGLIWYVSGRLPLVDAAQLVDKFRARWPALGRDRKFAHRLRLAGEPRYRLVVLANRARSEALFWLLTDRTDGENDSRESWQDATSNRTRLACYQWEAVRMPRIGAVAPSWTWSMTSAAFAIAKNEIRDAIRSRRAAQATAYGCEAATWPGFAGVRRQHAALAKIYAGEWRRIRSDDPPLWPRLRYVQRLPTR